MNLDEMKEELAAAKIAMEAAKAAVSKAQEAHARALSAFLELNPEHGPEEWEALAEKLEGEADSLTDHALAALDRLNSGLEL